jgi:antitoxin (DNA-binding transcriptional repressor) of toxin-antitoxin stability system
LHKNQIESDYQTHSGGTAMQALSATEVARNFSRLLDSLEHGGEEIVVMRNKHPVAKLVPGAARMTAIEALGDIFATLDDAEGTAWIEDIARGDRLRVAEARDPWA